MSKQHIARLDPSMPVGHLERCHLPNVHKNFHLDAAVAEPVLYNLVHHPALSVEYSSLFN